MKANNQVQTLLLLLKLLLLPLLQSLSVLAPAILADIKQEQALSAYEAWAAAHADDAQRERGHSRERDRSQETTLWLACHRQGQRPGQG